MTDELELVEQTRRHQLIEASEPKTLDMFENPAALNPHQNIQRLFSTWRCFHGSKINKKKK